MQEEISVLIIEDEEIWSSALAANLNDFGFTVAGVADNFEDAITALNRQNYDIVLLDININNRTSGLEIGRMMNELYRKPYIFITANSNNDTSEEAIKAQPSAYLVKPVTPTSLFISIQSAIANYRDKKPATSVVTDPPGFFFVKQGDKYKKLEWSDVAFLTSEKNYTRLYCTVDKAEYAIRSTLSKTLQFIVPKTHQKHFVQVNRSEAVNTNFISELKTDAVRTPYKELALTEGYAKGLKDVLNIIV